MKFKNLIDFCRKHDMIAEQFVHGYEQLKREMEIPDILADTD